jgi:hypothetical protein
MTLFEDDTQQLNYPYPMYSTRIQKQIKKMLAEDEKSKERDWDYYEKLRKKDLDKYLSPDTQKQMQDDILNNPDFGMPDDE